MYLIRKDNKYYLTYSKDVVEKFNNEHSGYMCDVTLLEEHNIPEKEEPPKYSIPDSGKFFNLRGITTPSEYATITIPHEAITAAANTRTGFFNGYPYARYNTQPIITTTNINSGATS